MKKQLFNLRVGADLILKNGNPGNSDCLKKDSVLCILYRKAAAVCHDGQLKHIAFPQKFKESKFYCNLIECHRLIIYLKPFTHV